MRKEDIRAREMYGDLLSRHGGEIAYIPLYDYKTKVAVSFIFLSAGIDGKMDNKLSPTDTLYTNTWWKDLDVYNYGESVLIHHHWEMYKKNRKTFNEEKFWKYYPPYPALEPRFSIIKYLFGKKDWVIQTDLIDYDKDPIQSASPAFPED
jgi:hypothetical protein